MRYRLLAKQGSMYGIPAKSKVREREGTWTLTAERGLMPRRPLKVSADRLEP